MNFKIWLEGRFLWPTSMPEDAENYLITKEIGGYHVYFFDRIRYDLDKNNRETQKHNKSLDHEEFARKLELKAIIKKLRNFDSTSTVMSRLDLIKDAKKFPAEYEDFLILFEKDTPISELSPEARKFFLSLAIGDRDFYGVVSAIEDMLDGSNRINDVLKNTIKQITLTPKTGISTWFTEELPKQINSNIQKAILEFEKRLEIKPVLNYKKTSLLNKIGQVAGSVIRQGMNYDFKSTVAKHIPLVERVINAYNAVGIHDTAKYPIWMSYQYGGEPHPSKWLGAAGTFDGQKANVFVSPLMIASDIVNILAHELGHSIYENLSKPQKLAIQKLAYTSPTPSAYGSVNYGSANYPTKSGHESGNEWLAEMIALIALNPGGNWNVLHKIKGALIPGYSQKMQVAGNEIRDIIKTVR